MAALGLPPYLGPTLIGLFERAKYRVKTGLRALGLDVRRARDLPPPPPLVDDPVEALRRWRSHDHVAFDCPLEALVAFNGFTPAASGWHPFTRTALEYLDTGRRDYDGSVLRRYFDAWQPSDGREALIGATAGPTLLERFPSYLSHAPWSTRTPEERDAYVKRVIEIENRSFGDPSLSPGDGYGLHGPVSREKGRLEYDRLIDLVERIRTRGYSRAEGDVTARVLKRGDDFRCLIVHGHHRTAAAAALGHARIPVIPEMLVEPRFVEHWPGVYRGFWTAEEALAYFDHLFDFDSLAWARERGLLAGDAAD